MVAWPSAASPAPLSPQHVQGTVTSRQVPWKFPMPRVVQQVQVVMSMAFPESRLYSAQAYIGNDRSPDRLILFRLDTRHLPPPPTYQDRPAVWLPTYIPRSPRSRPRACRERRSGPCCARLDDTLSHTYLCTYVHIGPRRRAGGAHPRVRRQEERVMRHHHGAQQQCMRDTAPVPVTARHAIPAPWTGRCLVVLSRPPPGLCAWVDGRPWS